MCIYDFKVTAQDGSEVSLSDYKGKVLLIVNTATGCGFTPQYDELCMTHTATRVWKFWTFPAISSASRHPVVTRKSRAFARFVTVPHSPGSPR